MIEVYVDGGCKDNQDPAKREAYCSYVIRRNNKEIVRKTRMQLGNATNNVAEYAAVITGIYAANDLNYKEEIIIYTDSQLVCSHIMNEWKASEHMMWLKDTLQTLKLYLPYKLVKVDREQIIKILGH